MDPEETENTETDKQPPSELETVKAEIAQIEQQIGMTKQQAAYHLLERDLHDEAYKALRQQMNQIGSQFQAKQVELQRLSQG